MLSLYFSDPPVRTQLMRASIIVLISALAASAATDNVVIRVKPAATANYTIPRTVYGTFLEPIGNSTYGGLWAQILENPSLEENLWNAAQLRRKFESNASFFR